MSKLSKLTNRCFYFYDGGLSVPDTKEMERGMFDRPPIKVKVIPRSNDVAIIVPLPGNPINRTQPNLSLEERRKRNKRARELGMLRDDI